MFLSSCYSNIHMLINTAVKQNLGIIMGFSPYILSYFKTSYEFKTKRFILDYLRAFMGKYDVLTLFYLLPHVKLTTTKYCIHPVYIFMHILIYHSKSVKILGYLQNNKIYKLANTKFDVRNFLFCPKNSRLDQCKQFTIFPEKKLMKEKISRFTFHLRKIETR